MWERETGRDKKRQKGTYIDIQIEGGKETERQEQKDIKSEREKKWERKMHKNVDVLNKINVK